MMTADAARTTTIAVLLYPGLTALDMVGPLQVLAALEQLEPRFRVHVVGTAIEDMPTDVPVGLVPSRTFAELSHPDVIVVPGGRLPTMRAMSDPAIRAWIQDAAPDAGLVTSVCTGSLILAAAGVLGEGPAATNWFFSGVLERLGVRYRHERWIHAGRVITSAGVSAGIDMSLYLVSVLTDEATARRVQALVDYDPQPPFGGIDWTHVPRAARLFRTGIGLASPLLTRRARRLLRSERERATRVGPAEPAR
jgi:transcriptional regulator GlxA family with amidase domain